MDFSIVNIGDWVYVESSKYVKIGRIKRISMLGFEIEQVTHWPRISPKLNFFFKGGPDTSALSRVSLLPEDITAFVTHSTEECYIIPTKTAEMIYDIIRKNQEEEK